jgi:CheY-like chemotaxis protein
MKSDQATILVTDDEAPIRLLLEQVLSSFGYTVLLAENGQRALEVIEENEIDLVLLDVQMPEMNGHEVARRLKTNPRTRHIPIIMLTGLSTSQHKVAGLSSGADEYVTKPIAGKELVARVHALLRMRDMQRELLQVEKDKYASKLAFAREVQSKLLPDSLPNVPSLDVAIAYQPCDGIGGDFYDHFAEGDDRLFIALGDAEGHGMNAALLMARAGAFLRSTLKSRNFSPSTLLSGVNELMCDDHCDEVLLPMVAFSSTCVKTYCGMATPVTYRLSFTEQASANASPSRAPALSSGLTLLNTLRNPKFPWQQGTFWSVLQTAFVRRSIINVTNLGSSLW